MDILISIPLGTNQLRHTMTTRFLLTCISSFFFDGEDTLDDLHEFIARDATELYHQGLTVALKTFGCFWNKGAPKSFILQGFSLRNDPAIGVPPFQETSICITFSFPSMNCSSPKILWWVSFLQPTAAPARLMASHWDSCASVPRVIGFTSAKLHGLT